MKLITFTVPCYNSAAYMDHCIETLLTAGEDAEIILVDDGSKDDTGKIADSYAEKYPTIVRVIHQENGGHGEPERLRIVMGHSGVFRVQACDDASGKPFRTLSDSPGTFRRPGILIYIGGQRR